MKWDRFFEGAMFMFFPNVSGTTLIPEYINEKYGVSAEKSVSHLFSLFCKSIFSNEKQKIPFKNMFINFTGSSSPANWPNMPSLRVPRPSPSTPALSNHFMKTNAEYEATGPFLSK